MNIEPFRLSQEETRRWVEMNNDWDRMRDLLLIMYGLPAGLIGGWPTEPVDQPFIVEDRTQ